MDKVTHELLKIMKTWSLRNYKYSISSDMKQKIVLRCWYSILFNNSTQLLRLTDFFFVIFSSLWSLVLSVVSFWNEVYIKCTFHYFSNCCYFHPSNFIWKKYQHVYIFKYNLFHSICFIDDWKQYFMRFCHTHTGEFFCFWVIYWESASGLYSTFQYFLFGHNIIRIWCEIHSCIYSLKFIF